MDKVKFSGYTRRNKREEKGIPFVITYHPNERTQEGLPIKTYIFHI